MSLSIGGLKKLCLSNAVELKFVRRNKLRIPPSRRMLCTLDSALLNSTLGKEILNFKVPRFSSPYNAASKGLLIVWDIIMQDWRAIPVDSCEVVSAVSTKPANIFWEYFNRVLGKMTVSQKKSFQDK
jgi:hypothetical protein